MLAEYIEERVVSFVSGLVGMAVGEVVDRFRRRRRRLQRLREETATMTQTNGTHTTPPQALADVLSETRQVLLVRGVVVQPVAWADTERWAADTARQMPCLPWMIAGHYLRLVAATIYDARQSSGSDQRQAGG